jgi:hypothetical protein
MTNPIVSLQRAVSADLLREQSSREVSADAA